MNNTDLIRTDSCSQNHSVRRSPTGFNKNSSNGSIRLFLSLCCVALLFWCGPAFATCPPDQEEGKDGVCEEKPITVIGKGESYFSYIGDGGNKYFYEAMYETLGESQGSEQDNTEEEKSGDTEQDCEKGNPVLIGNGNKVERELDFSTSHQFPLWLERKYSHYWKGVGVFGKHWISNFDYKLTFGTTDVDACYPRPGGSTCVGNSSTIWAWRPDGRIVKYTLGNDGYLHPDGPAGLSTISRFGQGDYLLTTNDGGVEIYYNTGYIKEIHHHGGTITKFYYGTSDQYALMPAFQPQVPNRPRL